MSSLWSQEDLQVEKGVFRGRSSEMESTVLNGQLNNARLGFISRVSQRPSSDLLRNAVAHTTSDLIRFLPTHLSTNQIRAKSSHHSAVSDLVRLVFTSSWPVYSAPASIMPVGCLKSDLPRQNALQEYRSAAAWAFTSLYYRNGYERASACGKHRLFVAISDGAPSNERSC